MRSSGTLASSRSGAWKHGGRYQSGPSLKQDRATLRAIFEGIGEQIHKDAIERLVIAKGNQVERDIIAYAMMAAPRLGVERLNGTLGHVAEFDRALLERFLSPIGFGGS